MKQQHTTDNTSETETNALPESDASQPYLPGMAPPETAEPAEPMTLTETLAALESENRALKHRVRLEEVRGVMTAELTQAGARSPELLFAVIKADLEFDDGGKPQNAGDLVEKLKQSYPEQFGTRVPNSIDGGAGQIAPQRLTRAALARMKPAEIAQLDWSEVRRVLAGN